MAPPSIRGGPQPDEPLHATPILDSRWGRFAVFGAALLPIWAVVIAIHVYAFDDPAIRSAVWADLSHLGLILTHIPRNAVLVSALALTFGAGIGPGDALLRAFRIPARDAFDRIAFGMVAGLAVLIAVAYLLATLHLLHRRFEVPLLLGGFAFSTFSVWRWLRNAPRLKDTVRVPRLLTALIWVLLAASLYVSLLAALTPEVGFDARYYHLAEAFRYAQHHGFFNLVASERIWAFALPHYQETVYAFEWVLVGAIGAKLIAWGGAVMTVLALIAFSRAWFSSSAIGETAALILFASPVVAWSATTAKNDLGAVPFVILALHCYLSWQRTESKLALGGAGFFLGITYGIKTFGAFAVIALGIVALRVLQRRQAPRRALLAQLLSYAGCALLAAAPALVTAQWMIGDPIFPLAPGIFHSQYGAATMGANVSNTFSGRLMETLDPANLVSLPWAMTMDPLKFRDLPGPLWLALLPIWAALPFFARRGTEVIRPISAFAAWFTALVLVSGAVEFRYLETALPVVALLIGYAVLGQDWRGARLAQVGLIASILIFSALGNGLVTRLQRGATSPAVMGTQYLNFAYLYENLPERGIMLQDAPILEYANAHLDPQRDKIYDAVNLQFMNMYSQTEIFNGTNYGGPAALNEWTLASPDAYARLSDAGCTYVVVWKEALGGMRATPLWKHLRLVTEQLQPGTRTTVELLKVVD